ncbi:phytoene/squalene synthase family protein [Rhodobium gokarnense]|uniref:Phytoene synthase n=1 Tax=Rhodobium gokarnense TaxID=364296 RepID=A0ABT3HBN0_9HYPH|nr:phytoene/squalene synthase family protein [Rhodobium gokarnense]MCW2307759.1 phytoene synthase [Rhodobium gokarnense]
MPSPDFSAGLGAADRAACNAIIRDGSKSFYAASLLLPPKPRNAARALYAFCRFSDDLIDQNDGGRAERLAERLDRIYAGNPVDHIADRAFASVVEEFDIPRTIPDALIEGFAWDEAGRDYGTIDDVMAYSARVASTVGVMMTIIMGNRRHAVLSRAADLGLAMQLTNIARDVGEDARMGRIYLPRDWLLEEAVDPDELLARPQHTPGIGRVTARLLATAEDYYRKSEAGIGALPIGCRPAIRSAALIYSAIGSEIANNGFDSTSRRAFVCSRRKVSLMANAVLTLSLSSPASAGATHPEARFLVDASALPDPAPKVAGPVRFLELLEISERRKWEWQVTGRAEA